LRQEVCEFEASLRYIVRLFLKQTTIKPPKIQQNKQMENRKVKQGLSGDWYLREGGGSKERV
jgi:hypothetical protein